MADADEQGTARMARDTVPMKGGKGGQGRQRSTQRVVEQNRPVGTTKKGSPKKDWGAIEKDADAPPPPPVKREPPRGKGAR